MRWGGRNSGLRDSPGSEYSIHPPIVPVPRDIKVGKREE